MTVSASAYVLSNTPTVSSALPAVLQNALGGKTIPFKNVLDDLPGFDALGGENVADLGEQTRASQEPQSKKTLPDASLGASQLNATQYVAPPMQFLPHQRFAQLSSAFGQAVQKDMPQQQEPVEQSSTVIPEAAPVESKPAPNAQPWMFDKSAPPKSSADDTKTVRASQLVNEAAATTATEATDSDRAAPAPSEEPVKQVKSEPLAAPEQNAARSSPEPVESRSSVRPGPRIAEGASTPTAKPLPKSTPAVPKEEPVSPGKADPPTAPKGARQTGGDFAPAAKPLLKSAPVAPTAPAEVHTAPEKPEMLPSKSATRALADVPLPQGSVDPQSLLPTPVKSVVNPPAATRKMTPSSPESAPVAIADPVQSSISTLPAPKPKEMISRRNGSPAPAPSHSSQASDQSTGPIPAPDRTVDSTSTQANTQATPVPVAAVLAPAPYLQGSAGAPRNEPAEPAIIPAELIVMSDTPAAPIAPKPENLAFAARMTAPRDSAAANQALLPQADLPKPQLTQPQLTQPRLTAPPQPAPQRDTQNPSVSNSKREAQTPSATADQTDTRVTRNAAMQQPSQAQPIVTRWTEVTAPHPTEVSSFSSISSDPSAPAHVSEAIAAQETHVVLPEPPKASASTDILLHFTGNDHSAAAIRVAERAGTVNVSVHASDPDLRESLRSNLGELSSQLSGQGWKAEMSGPASNTAQQNGQQNSEGRGQGSPQHEQSFGGDRQPQRERRTPGQWQQEFDQQVSSGDARPGGNR